MEDTSYIKAEINTRTMIGVLVYHLAKESEGHWIPHQYRYFEVIILLLLLFVTSAVLLYRGEQVYHFVRNLEDIDGQINTNSI